MFCPRLTHNVRLSQNGKIQVCGHMINNKGFNSVEELRNSQWLNELENKFDNNIWPQECVRCQEVENLNQPSIRNHSIKAHEKYVQLNKDYIFVTGLMDNVCNAACMMCSNNSSTYIGKLVNNVIVINNESLFDTIPKDQILVFEITGGEPSVSKAYKRALKSLTSATRYVRINTNGSKYIPEVEYLLKQGVEVTITLSVDGVGPVFEYIRWPINWDSFNKVVDKYKDLQNRYSNLNLDMWTSVSSLNINDFENIQQFSDSTGIPMSYALVHFPNCLSIKHKNKFTLLAQQKDLPMSELIGINDDNTQSLTEYIDKQDNIRKININNFIKI